MHATKHYSEYIGTSPPTFLPQTLHAIVHMPRLLIGWSCIASRLEPKSFCPEPNLFVSRR